MTKRARPNPAQSNLFSSDLPALPSTNRPLPAKPSRISAERNLEAWPLFVPSDSRAVPKVRRLVRHIPLKDGNVVEASVIVSFAADLGVLTTDDQKVYYGLVRMWEEDGRPETLTFSLRRLARTLKRSWGKKVPRSLVNSLRRLTDTPLTWLNSYHDSQRKRMLRSLESFKILGHLKIVELTEEMPRTTTENCEVRFHPLVLANLRNFHTKPVLFETAIAFESGVALLIYRHIDLMMADKTRYVRRSKELFEDIGLLDDSDNHEYRFKSRRVRTLERAFRELNGAQLTTGVLSTNLEPTKDGKDVNVVFSKRARLAAAERPAALPPPRGARAAAEAPEPDDAKDLLRHFYRVFHDHSPRTFQRTELRQAAELVEECGADAARFVVDFARRETPRDYKAQFFGFVLRYKDRALDRYERGASDRRRAECAGSDAACDLCGDAGVVWVRYENGKEDALGCNHDRETLAAFVARKRAVLLPRPGSDDADS